MNRYDYRNYAKKPSRIWRLLSTLTLIATVSIATAATKPVDRTPPVGYDPSKSVGLTNTISRPTPTAIPDIDFSSNKILGDVAEIQTALGLATADPTNNSQPTVRVIITLRPVGDNTSTTVRQSQIPSLDAALDGTDSSILQTWQHFPLALAEVTQVGLDQLLQSDAVAGLELDKLDEAHLISSRTVMGTDAVNAQGHAGGGTRINDPWEVVVIDTGVLSSHTAFGGRISSEACYNVGNTCPNGTPSMVGTGAGAPCTTASCDHGTHVAGIAASAAANAEPGGSANKANIVAINVFEWIPASAATLAYHSSQISALDHVYDLVTVQSRRIASVNMSLGGGSYSGTCDTANPSRTTAIQRLRDVGVMVVVSAGNGFSLNTMGAPACISHAVAVGNTNDDDTISPSSNASTAMDLWAPGNDITSSVSASTTSYASFTGTSMSAPQVAGSAAVLYDCEAGFAEAGNVPAGMSYDDFVLGAMTANGVSVTDSRVGGSVNKPRLNLLASSLAYDGNSNDAFATPNNMFGDSGSQYGFTPCASLEAGETQPGISAASKWFSWTASAEGSVEFSTCDARTTADTYLAAYRGSSLASLVLESSNDDDFSCASSSVHSTLTVDVETGDNLRLAVMAFSANSFSHGYYNLNWDFTPTPILPPIITSPVPGSTLSGSTETFQWTTASGATSYRVWLGSTSGGDEYGRLASNGTSAMTTTLPTDGSTVYATLKWLDGTWNTEPTVSYTAFSATAAATITSPVAGSILSGSSETFQWTTASGATSYRVWLGSTSGGDEYGRLASNGTSAMTTTLPTDGSTVYATLKWYDGSWNTEPTVSYTAFTASADATITSPVAGSTLNGSTETFQWSTAPGATSYRVWLGSTSGGDEYGRLASNGTSAMTTTLPTDGSTVYATLKWFDGTWNTEPTISYTAFTEIAAITSPVAGSTLSGSSETFQWSTAPGATSYRVWLGSTSGGDEYGRLASNGTSAMTTTLPTDGSTVYATLKWYDGSWNTEPTVSYTAFTEIAAITSPVAGSTLSGSTETFQWSTASGATTYRVWLGSTSGGDEYGRLASNGTSAMTTSLPTDGSTVYATLKWFDGTWHTETSVSYTASSVMSVFTSPTAGSTLSGGSTTFQWNAITSATTYRVWLGSTPGGDEYGRSASNGTSVTASGIPTNGSTVYATLKWFNGSWNTEPSVSYSTGP